MLAFVSSTSSFLVLIIPFITITVNFLSYFCEFQILIRIGKSHASILHTIIQTPKTILFLPIYLKITDNNFNLQIDILTFKGNCKQTINIMLTFKL